MDNVARADTLEKRENLAPNLEVAKALMSASHLLSWEPNCPGAIGKDRIKRGGRAAQHFTFASLCVIHHHDRVDADEEAAVCFC
jgi:hypothetical protein